MHDHLIGPLWGNVMIITVAEAVGYAARMWDVPAQYAQTPTYRSQSGTPPR